jgi:anaerobic selenocysteine-containing dehydrogenase
MTFSRFVDRGQLKFSTVRSSRFVVGFLCLSSLANAAGGKFADDGLWTLWSTLHFSSLARASSTDQNNSPFKHSSRSRPLKLSLSVLHRLAGPNEVHLAEVCGIEAPREHGLGTVATIEAMHRGDVKVFVALGGNFALATPDLSYTAEALGNCELTVQVSTKLSRSHLVHGKRALILPCLARTDKDRQASGEQGVTVEASMSMVHISYGMKEPGSTH